MFQQLIALLPKDVGTLGLIVAVAGTLGGLLLWIVGARFSRPLITLCTVSAGAYVGMMLPRWCEWEISGAGPAVGGAIVLGLSGYMLHRFWVGVGLGLLMTCWAALATWTMLNNGAQWQWPERDETTTLATFADATWQQVPADVASATPFTCATAMLSGLIAAVLWPRVGLVMLYSVAGVSLLVGMGIAAIDYGRPEWISMVPSHPSSQLLVLFGLVTFGALVQWWQMSAPAGEVGGEKGKETEK